MKEKRLNFRCETKLADQMKKAARDHKNLSAFLCQAMEKYLKHCRLIKQAEKLAQEKTVNISELRVTAK